MNSKTSAKLQMIISMFIFGTIGIFVRYIPLPSGAIAAVRGVVGTLFLILFMAITRKKINFSDIRSKALLLFVSGAAIGVNWILLFEAYRYTSVSKATLCYYLAPVFVMLASPFLLKERLTVKKTLCIATALMGMVFVSGVFEGGENGSFELLGILLGVLAAMVYASVVLMNKKLGDIGAYDRTVVQLGSAAVVVIPYSLIAENITFDAISPLAIILIIVVGIVHTGIAYALYFGAMKNLPAQSIAIYSYIDPIVAIILSTIILPEKMSVFGIVGAVMILASTFVCEVSFKRNRENKNDE